MGAPKPEQEIESQGSLKVGLVGGGRESGSLILACRSVDRIRVEILGVYDPDPEAPGMIMARNLEVFTSTSLKKLLALPGLNTVADWTGQNTVQKTVSLSAPPGCTYLDRRASFLLFNHVRSQAERIELERLCAEQRQILRQQQIIIDSLPYRIMVVNPDYTIDAVNQMFLNEFRVTRAQVTGKKCFQVRYGFTKPCSELGRHCFLEETLNKGQILSTIVDSVGPNGQERYEVVTVAPIMDEEGEIAHHLEASRDVTDRVRLEREVQRSNLFLQNVIQSAVDGIVVVDTKGRVLLFNQGMEKLTGLDAKTMAQSGHLSCFYSMEQARENMRRMRSDQNGPPGKLNPTSMTITNTDGETIPVTLSASIVEIEGREIGSVGVFTDMREIEEMRKDLSEAHLQLVQSEKIASVGRMAAGVAHEINNPLSIIMIHAELLEAALTDQEPNLADIGEIIDQVLRCKEIVADLLEFSRKSIGKAAPMNLGWLLERCLGLLTKLASFHDIEVIKDIQKGLPDMIGDLGQLEQVFTNLFTNAADAMEGRGRLKVEARFLPERDTFSVSVSDTGPGIPEEHRGNIFDIFFTTKGVGKGTGLGLSISKNIIELHGGSIRFECPPQGGTVFFIDLPREAMTTTDTDPVFIGMDDHEP